jgi:SAM-dependent methyltransferase
MEVYAHRNQAEAARDIENISKLIPLADNQPILDLACGNGRHSLELAARGLEVVGLDLSTELLTEARRASKAAGHRIEFVQSDMRQPPKENHFGTVLNLFTSFGYFDKDEENLAILEGMQRALRNDGWFLIDYINRELVLENLVAADSKSVNGKEIHQKRNYDEQTGRLNKTIKIVDGNDEREFLESLRLYTIEEIRQMATEAALEIKSVHGALDGRAFSQTAPRAILVGRKMK